MMNATAARGGKGFSPSIDLGGPGDSSSKGRSRLKWKGLALMVFLAILGCFLAGSVEATTFTVNTTDDTPDAIPSDNICADADGFCSLRAAIQESNANGDTANTVNVPDPNFYILTIDTPLTVTKNLTITGAGALDVVILADFLTRTTRIFTLNGSGAPGGIIDVNISGVTIQNGVAVGVNGGGFSLQSANLVFSDSFLLNNSAIAAGGVGGNGGGLYIDVNSSASLLGITGVDLNFNVADGNGGGVYNEGTLNLENTVIDSNLSLNGGGIYQTLTGLTLIDTSTISANSAQVTLGGLTVTGGGGIYNLGSLFLQRSLLANNFSEAHGGGIYNNGVLDATNVTFSGNVADPTTGLGGALRNLHAVTDEVILQFVTMNENTASAGGGINNTGFVGLQSTILAGSTGGNCAGTAVTSLGSNLDSANTCGLANAGDLINSDPLLQALADNGGPTFTHALLQGSPAINAGIFDDQVITDQRLLPRPFPAATPMDMGAFEYQGAAEVDLVVTKTDLPDPVFVLSNLNYTITVINNGPFAAHGVLLTDSLDPTVTFVSVISDQGLCSHFAGIVSCTIPTLGVGETANITVVVTPNMAVPITNEITATSAGYENETTPADNTASTTTVVTNPVPVITTLNPAVAVLNGPAFSLTVNGSNFVTGAVVRWNGTTDLNTFYVSSTQLTADVPANLLALPGPGSAAITVLNPLPVGGESTPPKPLPINPHLYLPLIFK